MENYWGLKSALPNEVNHEVVNQYLLSIKLANHSEGTIIQYRRFLERFFGDMIDSYANITSDKIYQWFISNQGHVKETTFSLRLSILSSFYTFCVEEEYITRSPIKRRWFPILPQTIPKYLEKNEIAKTRIQSERRSLRDLALVEFMLSSGCRVGEVHPLNRDDVDFENRTFHVVGKGNKIRQVHFSERCAVYLEKYIKTLPNTSEALFVTVTGGRLSIRAIQDIMNRIGKGAELASSLHPHRLRHTFATEMLSKGAELTFISEELGHADVNTTQIYARLPKKEIISLYRKYMG
ncbi:tyrosine-type recombinase/integrase [Pontibacillus yanchengensis]|uniref:Tyrosine-type recombinase/integrase n=1 Tax=Pontibacillus yanchengensis TaxID=462910 RepID=A0A6I5A184_9BACI|nr:tyrosine-type recombinase/integrase [Pontibacillus yanchengensis]MYL34290.1 tyrosine-type recombinase/integrase [Pontibacillus yanchengensis]